MVWDAHHFFTTPLTGMAARGMAPAGNVSAGCQQAALNRLLFRFRPESDSELDFGQLAGSLPRRCLLGCCLLGLPPVGALLGRKKKRVARMVGSILDEKRASSSATSITCHEEIGTEPTRSQTIGLAM